MTSPSPAAPESVFRLIRTPAYVILSLALVLPFMDYINGLFPLRLGDPLWRFGATSLIASYAVATTVQLFFLFVVAAGSLDRKVLIAIAVFAGVIAVGILGGSALFVLDAIQTRARTSAGTQTRLETTAAVVMLKLVTLVIANFVLARAAMKLARQGRSAAVKPDQLLVRRPSKSTAPSA